MGEGSPKKSAASLLFHVVPPPTFSTSFHIVVLPSLSPDLLLLLLIALVTTCNGLRLTSLFQPARQRRESACCITRSNSRNILCVHVLLLWPLTALHESTALDKRIPYPPFSLSADDAYPSGNNECKLCASRRPSVSHSSHSFVHSNFVLCRKPSDAKAFLQLQTNAHGSFPSISYAIHHIYHTSRQFFILFRHINLHPIALSLLLVLVGPIRL